MVGVVGGARELRREPSAINGPETCHGGRWRWRWRRNGQIVVVLSFVVIRAKSNFTTITHVIIFDHVVVLKSVVGRRHDSSITWNILREFRFCVEVALQAADTWTRENAENLPLMLCEVSWGFATKGFQVVAQESRHASQTEMCELWACIQQSNDTLENKDQ